MDNVVYRAGLGSTRAQARQIASHGLLNLNGKRITVPSIQVKVGDVLQVRPKKASSPLFEILKTGKEKIKTPSWLKLDAKNLSIEILAIPAKEELEQIIDSQLIVEYYSK